MPQPSSGSYIINGISGIWNSYGCPINPSEGLQLYVENSNESESLIDLVGFDTSIKDIGLLKDKKEISELVVMLPMLERYKQYIYFDNASAVPEWVQPPDPCQPCDENIHPCEEKNNTWEQQFGNDETYRKKGLVYCVTEDAWLFVLSESIINKILDVIDYKQLSINEIKQILDTKSNLNRENNIVKLMLAMTKYNFPPHLNWLLFPKQVPAYVMYTAEFTATLDKQDLSNIWQGTMPKLAQEPQEQEIEIEHFLTDEELFGGYDIADFQDIKLSIFKCKLRASNNYYNYLKKSYGFKAALNTEFSERSKWYQYNWPYDNFSLLELLKVDGGEIREFIKPEDVSDSVLVTQNVNMQSVIESKAFQTYINLTEKKKINSYNAYISGLINKK